ncbi:MAG TPA: hypothetical protein DCP90_05680 [Clostridiales bacterium]|nr:MAG: hypothetical protein A2Y22_04995 [Clostridiales bacterium GWD2_32_59]HAN10091.1 hypothetical protein [Clostridiales bacterium]
MRILIKDVIIKRPILSVNNKENNITGVASMLIEDDSILEIYEEGKDIGINYDKIIEGNKKLHAFVDLIDIHVHLRTPGLEYKEDMITGTRAAARGGFTHIVCMANTKPVADNKETLKMLNSIIKEQAVVNVYPVGALTKDLKGTEMADIDGMAEENIIALSDDGFGLNDEELLYKSYTKGLEYGLPVLLHCQLGDMDAYDRNSEIKAVELSLDVLKKVPDARVHIQHVSTKESIDLVVWAQKNGFKVTMETCPHYITLIHADIEKYKGSAIMNPPLREEADKEYSIKMLKENIINVVSTDHAPHSIEEKTGVNIMNGIIGLESSIPIVASVINDTEKMVEILLNQMSKTPCEIVNIPYNQGKANITIIDLEEEYKLNINEFESKGRNCPYDNFDVKSRVIATICNGKLVYEYKK